ncbi:hypothetical protein PSCICE_28610 [Pseudomonas cichorii]|nr:hypothetical protein PSCICE_28610 [Pseudomonas cichorii]
MNAVDRQHPQGLDQFIMVFSRYTDPQNAGELPGHARHAALQPVAAMIGDALGDTLDLTRFVGCNHSDYEMIHR